MRIFGKSGRLGLLRSEEALLLAGKIEAQPRRFSMRLSHYTMLQLSCCFVSYENWRHLRRRNLHSRQGYAFSALLPEIPELHTMTCLLDLERQGYGFRAAKLCFKSHVCEISAIIWRNGQNMVDPVFYFPLRNILSRRMAGFSSSRTSSDGNSKETEMERFSMSASPC